jgi:CheY-like chemotaxis protein
MLPDLAPDTRPAGSYVVLCYTCAQQFDATQAEWCGCEMKTRTLKCPRCASCFCRATPRYKERFWEIAPGSLAGNTNRFRLGDGEIVLHTGPAAPRVLIVDDEEHIRSLIVCYVEQMGYDVTSVSRPKDALVLLLTGRFDIVITDALMPGMDGREMCRQIKDEYGDRIRVIVMTSLYTATRFKNEGRHQFGADDYLTKPLPFGVLKASLDRISLLRA